MIRLRVREFVEEHTPPRLSRYKLGRDAGLSPAPMDKIWNEPENTEILLSTLEKIARALSQYVGRYVSTKELYEDIPDIPEV
ncbi:MAG: helix-turn-helix domain-containing protein [Ktedonobacteraceae bacterium]